jgi:1-acyl-sn-glycerol-3-phosphate acyltransferase
VSKKITDVPNQNLDGIPQDAAKNSTRGMKWLVGRAVGRALGKTAMSREEFAYKVLPGFLLDLMKRYLRVRGFGLRNVPSRGPFIVLANHSGFMGFDALMIAHYLNVQKKTLPHIIAHKLWFLSPEISVHAEKLGLVPATYNNGLKLLEDGKPLLLFPEGEEGNFKPTKYRYRLRPFRRGFVRLALMTGAPIVPTIVIGAEETHITLSQIRWAKDLLGIIVPVPLNLFPLPAKWQLHFLPPIYLEKNPEKAQDMKYVTELSRRIRRDFQKEMNLRLRDRKLVFV